MTLDLDQLDALASAASPGPWTTSKVDLRDRDGNDILTSDFGHSCGDFDYPADAAFVAAARQAVPELVARVRELEAEVARLRAR